MTEAESLELAATFTANASTNFTIFISFTFGFLATAYFVGRNLTRFQALAAAGLYSVAAGSAALSCVAWLQAFGSILARENTLLETLPLFSGALWVVGMSVLFIAGLSLSLYFMWNIRQINPK